MHIAGFLAALGKTAERSVLGRHLSREVPSRLGLRRTAGTRRSPRRFEGQIGGLEVVVDLAPLCERATITANGAGVIAEHMEMVSWDRLRLREERPLPATVSTGDPDFDRALRLRGDAATALALLDPALRHEILSSFAAEGGLELAGAVLAFTPETQVDRRFDLVRCVQRTVALARRLAAPNDIHARLAARAYGDPLPTARMWAAWALAAFCATDERTPPILTACLSDASDAVRLVAAKALGAGGRVTAIEIASYKPDDEETSARARRAQEALGTRTPVQRAQAILAAAIDARRRDVAAAAIQALGRIGDQAAVERLAALIDRSDMELGQDAARALALVGRPETESILIAALESGDQGVRFAAVEALGRSGRAPTLGALRALLAQPGIGDSTRMAVRSAIDRVQDRMRRIGMGHLSIADERDGRVSLAGEEGRVSLADERDGPG